MRQEHVFPQYHCYISAWPDSQPLQSLLLVSWDWLRQPILRLNVFQQHFTHILGLTPVSPRTYISFPSLDPFPHYSSLLWHYFPAEWEHIKPTQDGCPQWVYTSPQHTEVDLTLPAHPYHLPHFIVCPLFQPLGIACPPLNTLSGGVYHPIPSIQKDLSLIHMKKSPYIIPDAVENNLL